MRPQHNAAENLGGLSHEMQRLWASMRPQHNAAENLLTAQIEDSMPIASMRPQHNAAENTAKSTALSLRGGLQ